MLSNLLIQSCTITHRSPSDERDEYGRAVDAETTIETMCALHQRQRSEDIEHGQLSRTEWLLLLPADTTIGTADTVTVDDVAYEVVGEPWDAKGGTEMAHVEATVVRTSSTGEVAGAS